MIMSRGLQGCVIIDDANGNVDGGQWQEIVTIVKMTMIYDDLCWN